MIATKAQAKAQKNGNATTAHDMLSAYGFNALKLIGADGKHDYVQCYKILKFHAEQGQKRHGLELRPSTLLSKARKTIKSFTGEATLPVTVNEWLEQKAKDMVFEVVRRLHTRGFEQEHLSAIKIDVKLDKEDLSKSSVSQVQNVRFRNDYSHIRKNKKLTKEQAEDAVLRNKIRDLRWSIQDLTSSCRNSRKKIDETKDFIQKATFTDRLEKSEDKLLKQRQLLWIWSEETVRVTDCEDYLKQFDVLPEVVAPKVDTSKYTIR